MLNLILTILYRIAKFKHGEYPLSILYYHHVFAQTEAYHPDDLNAQQFEQQIKYLSQHFNIISLHQAIDLLKQGNLPPKALVISFDDGYLDNYTIAAPILEKHQCSASFFIATKGVDEGYLWNDKIEQAIKLTSVKNISANIIGKELNITTTTEKIAAFQKIINKLKFKNDHKRDQKIKALISELKSKTFEQSMMNPEQILDLHNRKFTIGAHTHSHTILSTESNNNAKNELVINKEKLENIIQDKIDFLAFPNGLYGRDFTLEHCNITEEIGFKAAFSTNDGGATSSHNLYQIPRFMPYRKQLPLFALSIAKIAGEHV